MRFRPRTDEDPQLNITPLIDVVLLLLVFFMVSTTFSRESRLAIELPEAGAPDSVQEQRPLEVEISADGRYAIRGPAEPELRTLRSSDTETLRRALQQAMGGDRELVTVIRADRATPHEAVVRVMDTARRLGITHLTFATQVDPAGEGQ